MIISNTSHYSYSQQQKPNQKHNTLSTPAVKPFAASSHPFPAWAESPNIREVGCRDANRLCIIAMSDVGVCVYLCRLQPWLEGARFASPSCCSTASWQRRHCRPTNATAGGSFPPRSRLSGGKFGPLLIEGPSCCVWTHQVCTSHSE